MAKILLVEDDRKVSDTLLKWLVSERHTVDLVTDGLQAEHFLAMYKYDVVIIDWMLPGKSGVDVCKEFRDRGGKTPVLIMTGRSQTSDKVAGLDAGADDYLTKPVDVLELSARIRSLLRRPEDLKAQPLHFGDLTLDPASSSFIRNGKVVQLTAREYSLLEFLVRHRGQYFTAETLLDRIWSSDADTTPLSVRVYIKRLRNKIDSSENSMIENVKGLGYRLRNAE